MGLYRNGAIKIISHEGGLVLPSTEISVTQK